MLWDHTFNHIIPRNALKMYLIFNNWADLPYMFPLLWLLTGEKPSIWVSWLKFSHLHFKVWDDCIVRMAVGKKDDFKQLEFSLDTSTLLGCGSTGRQLESCRWGWSHLKLWGDLFPQTCLESVVCCGSFVLAYNNSLWNFQKLCKLFVKLPIKYRFSIT